MTKTVTTYSYTLKVRPFQKTATKYSYSYGYKIIWLIKCKRIRCEMAMKLFCLENLKDLDATSVLSEAVSEDYHMNQTATLY